METIGDKIRFIRSKKQLNQAELAKELGISRSYLSCVENGQKQPSEILKNKISEMEKDCSGLTVERILYYFDSFPADAVLEVISQAIANGDTDIANTLIQRLKNRTNDKA